LCLPVAAFLGYLLATPLDFSTFLVVGLTLLVLMIPVFLRFHHVWLIAVWNMSALAFFLPGRPPLWLLLSFISLLIAALQYALHREQKFVAVSSIVKPLILLTIVLLVTAKFTGGI